MLAASALVLASMLLANQPATAGSVPSRIVQIERGLAITRRGQTRPDRVDLPEALRVLHIPSVGIALIDRGRLAWSGAFGSGSKGTVYQAASLSKIVTAVAALRLVQQGHLALDQDVETKLRSWHLPPTPLTRAHPVTLRGLLSMTAGIGVPGYAGYAPGARLPTLPQILDGLPPATSPPVRVEYVPGTRYAYSGGGYEIVQALIEDVTHRPFAEAADALVLRPFAMRRSVFSQPPTASVARHAASGHRANGEELPGRWRVVPELAAGGLWSTPSDLATFLIEIARAYRGEDTHLLTRAIARAMLTRQNVGPYGLGVAITGDGRDLALKKRGQNVGYQGYMVLFPLTGQGMVVMTGSDNGSILADALIRRAAIVFGWPPLGTLPD